MTNATSNPTQEQFQVKIEELRQKRCDLILETGKDATEEFFIQEELDDVEGKIARYTKRMNDLYGANS